MSGELTAGQEPSRYAAYYCEENIWFLCQEPRFEDLAPHVVWISNPARTCPIWNQRVVHAQGLIPAQAPPVIWDYHVVLMVRGRDGIHQIWDLDTTLGCPVDAETYCRDSFLPVGWLAPPFAQWFRVVEARQYVESFSSDRSHMLDATGSWLQEPPPWGPIQVEPGANNLMEFVSVDGSFIGTVMNLHSFARRFCPGILT